MAKCNEAAKASGAKPMRLDWQTGASRKWENGKPIPKTVIAVADAPNGAQYIIRDDKDTFGIYRLFESKRTGPWATAGSVSTLKRWADADGFGNVVDFGKGKVCDADIGHPMTVGEIKAWRDKWVAHIPDLDAFEVWDHECEGNTENERTPERDPAGWGAHLVCGLSSPTSEGKATTLADYLRGDQILYPNFNHGCDELRHQVLDVRVDWNFGASMCAVLRLKGATRKTTDRGLRAARMPPLPHRGGQMKGDQDPKQ